MKATRAQHVAVGAFVLGMLVLGVVLLAQLTGGLGRHDGYLTHFDSVLGIEPGTRVLFDGFAIGRVAGVEPAPPEAPGRFRVHLAVVRDWAIPEDSEARVIQRTLLAPMEIEIRGGSAERELRPGEAIAGGDSTNLIGAMSSLTVDVDRMLDEAVRPLLGEVADSAPAILRNLEDFSGSLAETGRTLRRLASPENAGRVERMLVHLDRGAENVASLTGSLDGSRRELDRALGSVNELLEGRDRDVDAIVRDVRHVVASVAGRIDAVNANLEGASQNLYEFSRELRANPGVLFGGRQSSDPDATNAVTADVGAAP